MKATNQRLNSFGVKAETEGPPTRAEYHHIIKDGTDPHRRICKKSQQTIGHIVLGCPELAKTEYIHRQNSMTVYVHWKICQGYERHTTDKWCEHDPKTVEIKGDITIIYDLPIHTDREITASRPDIVVNSNQDKTKILPSSFQKNCKNIKIWKLRSQECGKCRQDNSSSHRCIRSYQKRFREAHQ